MVFSVLLSQQRRTKTVELRVTDKTKEKAQTWYEVTSDKKEDGDQKKSEPNEGTGEKSQCIIIAVPLWFGVVVPFRVSSMGQI